MFQNTTHSSDAYMPHEQEMGNNAQAIAIHGGSRKRKMTDDSAFVSMSSSDEITPPMETLAQRRKLTMPRCMPNGQGEEEEYVQFLPLPEELNRQVLAGLSMLPGQGNASALFKNLQQNSSHSGSPAVAFPGASDSPCSTISELQPGTPRDGFFGKALYPDFHIYPTSSSNDGASSSRERLDSTGTSAGAGASASFGIFEPALGAQPHDAMCLDEPSAPSSTTPAPASGHGPQCRSIPQLSVRYHDGNSSELWATCPDCGACSKVQESQPSVGMCYSP